MKQGPLIPEYSYLALPLKKIIIANQPSQKMYDETVAFVTTIIKLDEKEEYFEFSDMRYQKIGNVEDETVDAELKSLLIQWYKNENFLHEWIALKADSYTDASGTVNIPFGKLEDKGTTELEEEQEAVVGRALSGMRKLKTKNEEFFLDFLYLHNQTIYRSRNIEEIMNQIHDDLKPSYVSPKVPLKF